MLKRKALRKILITTFSVFTLFVLYLIPVRIESSYLDTEKEIIYTSNTTNQEIYLLGENHYLVKFQIFLDGSSKEENIAKILEYLRVNSSLKVPVGLSGILPERAQILDIKVEGTTAILNFSKELLDVTDALEERMIESLIYSVTGLSDIDGIRVQVEGELLRELPKTKKKLDEVLTREFGINKVYDITNRNGIQKVTIYYLDKISNNNYYVPVTKYLNDDREKIKIIIDNLASNYIYEEHLMSYLNHKTTLLDYDNQEDTFTINLNEAVFGGGEILEEVEYTLGYSIFENYDVTKVLFQVNGETVKELER